MFDARVPFVIHAMSGRHDVVSVHQASRVRRAAIQSRSGRRALFYVLHFTLSLIRAKPESRHHSVHLFTFMHGHGHIARKERVVKF